jgi:hypothetical protein
MKKEVNTDRRQFTKVVGVGGLVISASLLAPLLTGNESEASESLPPTGRRWSDLSAIDCADLEPHIGQGFALFDEDGSRLGTLFLKDARSCADQLPQSDQRSQRVPFSLLFYLPKRFLAPLENRIYSLAHRDLKRTSLFINSVGPSGRYYEACFS